jgi:hypothetical protein
VIKRIHDPVSLSEFSEISDITRQKLKNLRSFGDSLAPLQARPSWLRLGCQTKFALYEAEIRFGNPELGARDRDEQLSAMTWQASQYFEAGDFASAESAYRGIIDNFPSYPVAKYMLTECEEVRGAYLRDIASEEFRRISTRT